MSVYTAWPVFLYLLCLIPLIVAAYVWSLRRRRRSVIRYSSLSLVKEAASHRSWLRRHLPFILFLLALSSLVIALSRPTAEIVVPSNRATIILAMDVSRSMCTVDIPPNRLEAAKAAALSFVESETSGRKIGVVAFAGTAELIQPPTDNHFLLENAIMNLTTAHSTAIGSAIIRSLETIAEFDNQIVAIGSEEITGSNPVLAPGEFAPHMIVLLTDGSSNDGPNPLGAAQQALEGGIRIYTIGFGTVNNQSPMNCSEHVNEEKLEGGPDVSSPIGGGDPGSRRELDEVTLRQVAEATGGAYYAASSAGELQDVFRAIPVDLILQRETVEGSVYFNAFAILTMMVALTLSSLWHT